MNVVLTGHTSGIGKVLASRLPNSIGISRSNGYDISYKTDRKKIIDLMYRNDILINNAYHCFAQTELLLDFYLQFKNDPKKKIICIGSNGACDNLRLPEAYIKLLKYRTCKRSLKDMASYLKNKKPKCVINYISLGYVGTEKILKKYPKLENYISVSDAAHAIMREVF